MQFCVLKEKINKAIKMEEEIFINVTDLDVGNESSVAERLCSENATAAAAEGLNCSKFAVAAPQCVEDEIPMI